MLAFPNHQRTFYRHRPHYVMENTVSQGADSFVYSYVLLHCFIISQQHNYLISPFSKNGLGSQSIAHCDCVFAGQPRAAGNSGAGGGEYPGSAASFSPRSTPPACKTRRPGPEPSRQLLSTDGPTAGGCAERKNREKEGDWLTAVLARLRLSGSFALLCSQQGGRGHAFVSVILVNSCLFPSFFFFISSVSCSHCQAQAHASSLW